MSFYRLQELEATQEDSILFNNMILSDHFTDLKGKTTKHICQNQIFLPWKLLYARFAPVSCLLKLSLYGYSRKQKSHNLFGYINAVYKYFVSDGKNDLQAIF